MSGPKRGLFCNARRRSSVRGVYKNHSLLKGPFEPSVYRNNPVDLQVLHPSDPYAEGKKPSTAME